MSSPSFADGLWRAVSSLVSRAMEDLCGPGIRAPVLGPFSGADFAVLTCILLAVLGAHGVVALVMRRKRKTVAEERGPGDWRQYSLRASTSPMCLLIWVAGFYAAATTLLLKVQDTEAVSAVHRGLDKLFDVGLFAALLWLFFRGTRVLETVLLAWAARRKSKIDTLAAPLLARSLRVFAPVMGVIFALPVAGLPPEYAGVVSKGSSIMLIGAVSWVLCQAVSLGEKTVLGKYDVTAADNLLARKVFTQIHFVARSFYALIGVFTIASVLMLFAEVRHFGASILTSAGVLGIIAGLAAQHSIANMFAGFQLAMTQPIRIDDVLVVDGQWGRVEEITLTYVVIRIWDDRRLIVPLNYFIEQPFENWTRVSASLLGSVLLWTDYTLPIAQVRKAVQQIVEKSAYWDRRFWNLQVSDATERAMQIRVLATAVDSGKSWDLRCEIREKLIEYIQAHHPGCLPKDRVVLSGGKARPSFVHELSAH